MLYLRHMASSKHKLGRIKMLDIHPYERNKILIYIWRKIILLLEIVHLEELCSELTGLYLYKLKTFESTCHFLTKKKIDKLVDRFIERLERFP